MRLKQIRKIAKILYLSEQKEDSQKQRQLVECLVDGLKKRNKLSFLLKILKEFEKISKRNQAVLIFSREETKDNLKGELKKELSSELNGLSNLKTKIDPDIIGGFIIKTKNHLIDGSVKGLLRRIKNTKHI